MLDNSLIILLIFIEDLESIFHDRGEYTYLKSCILHSPQLSLTKSHERRSEANAEIASPHAIRAFPTSYPL